MDHQSAAVTLVPAKPVVMTNSLFHVGVNRADVRGFDGRVD
jgi:hypothetical protein